MFTDARLAIDDLKLQKLVFRFQIDRVQQSAELEDEMIGKRDYSMLIFGGDSSFLAERCTV